MIRGSYSNPNSAKGIIIYTTDVKMHELALIKLNQMEDNYQ